MNATTKTKPAPVSAPEQARRDQSVAAGGARTSGRPQPVALTRVWIPRTDVDWLEELRMRHVGQVATWERTEQALNTARSGDFEGLAEDVALAAEELARIVADCARLIRERALDPAIVGIDASDLMVHRVRGCLRLDQPSKAAAA
jgi:hypothetical protein